jgi:glycosyltransferase involved in cell wall biosynthesis
MTDKYSIILPCFNEQENIKNFIRDLNKLQITKEIIVVDNNSNDRSSIEIKKTNAKYIFEKRQGYGFAIKRGINEAKNNVIIVCEPDATFCANDLHKLIAYSKDFDCVFGTRTSRTTIGENAKMNFFLRYGNIIVAKFLEYLFSGPTLTDVGCTLKLFRKKNYKMIKKNLQVNDSTFQPELMINLINKNFSIIEIPVHYNKRAGYSKITYNFNSSFLLGLKMIILIIKLKFLKTVKPGKL